MQDITSGGFYQRGGSSRSMYGRKITTTTRKFVSVAQRKSPSDLALNKLSNRLTKKGNLSEYEVGRWKNKLSGLWQLRFINMDILAMVILMFNDFGVHADDDKLILDFLNQKDLQQLFLPYVQQILDLKELTGKTEKIAKLKLFASFIRYIKLIQAHIQSEEEEENEELEGKTEIPPEESKPTIFPYDNLTTSIYKAAQYYGYPTAWMIVSDVNGTDTSNDIVFNDQRIETLGMFIDRRLAEGDNPFIIKAEAVIRNKTLQDINVGFAYIDNLGQENLDPQNQIDYEKILPQVNDFYEKLGEPKFNNVTTLRNNYEDWLNTFDFYLDEDLKIYQKIQKVQDIVKKSKTLFTSNIIQTGITVSFEPKYHGNAVSQDDGLDIFNIAVATKQIPFIKYNDNYGSNYIKVYNPPSTEDHPNYKVLTLDEISSNRPNTVYLVIWIGSGSLSTVIQDNLYVVKYYLDKNSIEIDLPVKTDIKNFIKTNIEKAFPELELGNGVSTKTSGNFDMYQINYEDDSFLDIVLLDDLFKYLIYIDENNEPFAFKKRLDIHYRPMFTDLKAGEVFVEEKYIKNPSTVSAILNNSEVTRDIMVERKTRSGKESKTFKKGDEFIHVIVQKSDSVRHLALFHYFLPMLMKYYSDKKDEIEKEYNKLIPELSRLKDMEKSNDETRIVEAKAGDKIRELKRIAPELFVDYSSECPTERQPIILTTQKARQDWSGEILAYPKTKPWYFACPENQYPHPGLKVNKSPINRDTFKYIPCCFKKDQHNIDTPLDRYEKNMDPTDIQCAKADIKIRSTKMLCSNRLGYLPKNIETILDRGEGIMSRYGVTRDINSFLHCVITALSNYDLNSEYASYLNLGFPEDRSKYISDIRNRILDDINPEVMKQELYEYNVEEIREMFESDDWKDETKFFDPLLFYRAIEEFFDVNIFIFGGGNDDTGDMILPRFALFHASVKNIKRPTIIIFRNTSAKFETYPQCELIVEHDEDSNDIEYMFDENNEDIYLRCYEILENILTTTTWSIENSKVNIRSVLYLDVGQLFSGFKQTGQILDDYGKLRALNIELYKGYKMTFFTQPTQPLNLPIENTIHRIGVDNFLNYFEQSPEAVTKDEKGRINGFWLKLFDWKYGAYVPLKPFNQSKYDNLPLGPIVIPEKVMGVTERNYLLKKQLNIFRQIVLWLYSISEKTPNDFIKSYFSKVDSTESLNYYNFDKLRRKFPNVKNINEAMEYIASTTNVVRNIPQIGYKIIFYNTDFMKKFISVIRIYSNQIETSVLEFIQGFYVISEDFDRKHQTKIFTNFIDYTEWVKYVSNQSVSFKIKTAIGFKDDEEINSFAYKDTDGKIYLIQNVFTGNKNRAAKVGENWVTKTVNTGFYTPEIENIPIYKIYALDTNGKIVFVEDATNGGQGYISMLYYGSPNDFFEGKESKYAAILEIL